MKLHAATTALVNAHSCTTNRTVAGRYRKTARTIERRFAKAEIAEQLAERGDNQ